MHMSILNIDIVTTFLHITSLEGSPSLIQNLSIIFNENKNTHFIKLPGDIDQIEITNLNFDLGSFTINWIKDRTNLDRYPFVFNCSTVDFSNPREHTDTDVYLSQYLHYFDRSKDFFCQRYDNEYHQYSNCFKYDNNNTQYRSARKVNRNIVERCTFDTTFSKTSEFSNRPFEMISIESAYSLLSSNRDWHCQKFRTPRISWIGANETCKKYGGILPVIRSKDELKEILTLNTDFYPIEFIFLGMKINTKVLKFVTNTILTKIIP